VSIHYFIRQQQSIDLARAHGVLAAWGWSHILLLPLSGPARSRKGLIVTQTEQKAAARKERLEAGKSVEDAVNAAREGKDTLWKAIMYEVLHREGMSLQLAHEIKLKAGLTQ